MKLWEKAKEKFPALGRIDFVTQTCPDLLELAEKPKNCPKPYEVMRVCEMCWDREVEP